MCGSCKKHKKRADGCQLFRPILSALKHLTYKLAKYLAPILEPLTTIKYTVKDSFNFAPEVVKRDSSNFMGSLDIGLPFTNIPFEKTIEICINILFKNNDIVHGLKKSEFKDLLSLAKKESYFIFNNVLYKPIDRLAIGLRKAFTS